MHPPIIKRTRLAGGHEPSAAPAGGFTDKTPYLVAPSRSARLRRDLPRGGAQNNAAYSFQTKYLGKAPEAQVITAERFRQRRSLESGLPLARIAGLARRFIAHNSLAETAELQVVPFNDDLPRRPGRSSTHQGD